MQQYSKLTSEEKEIVDTYISLIQSQTVETFNNIEDEELKRINMKLGILKASVENCYLRIESSILEIKGLIDEESSKKEEKSFINTLKEGLPLIFKNRAQKIQTDKKSYDYNNLDRIIEKLESIRIELSINAQKLYEISKESEKHYIDIQYKIIALQELLRQSQEEKTKSEQDVESIKERNLLLKLNYYRGVSRNEQIILQTSRILAQKSGQSASEYEQYIDLVINYNDYVADIYNQLENRMNEMLKAEKQYFKAAIEKTQNIPNSIGNDSETETALDSNGAKPISLKAAKSTYNKSDETCIE